MSDDASRGGVLSVLKLGALVFVGAWISVSLATVMTGGEDDSIAESLAFSAFMAGVITLVVPFALWAARSRAENGCPGVR